MRRRRNQAGDDSLDMLLDTITNTFGGIVFLAMLIVILLGSSRPPSSDPSVDAEFQSIRSEIDRLRQEKSEMEQLQVASKIVSSLVDMNAAEESIAKAKLLAAQHVDVQAQIQAQLEARLKLGESLRQSAEKAHAGEHELKDAETQLDSLSAQVDNEIKARSQEIDLPKERATTKDQTVILVRNSTVYSLDEEPQVSGLQINSRDFEKCSPDDAMVILHIGAYRTRSQGGFAMTDEINLRRTFSRIDSKEDFVTVAIWEDSFEHFSILRKMFRELKLEYQLVLMTPGQVISESPRTTAPKVQ